MKKILAFVLILGIMFAMTGLVIGQNPCNDAESEGPPFSEGPQAERCNRMHDEAPAGPLMWKGGPI